MKYNNIFSISIKQIEIFLKCYQYRNFSRVAAEYNFTPSMISKTIVMLENRLGMQLFIRKYHSLEPTPAAVELAKGWSRVLDGIITSISRASDANEQNASSIRIGLLETTRFCSDYVLDKLETYCPGDILKRIIWERRDLHALTDALVHDEFDLIITSSVEIPFLDETKFHRKKIFSSPRALFIPRNHPLFNKEDVTMADCRNYPFITWSQTRYPHLYSELEEICRKAGFSPIISVICGSAESARDNLYMGKGLHIASSLICSGWENEDIRKVELAELPATDLVVFWKAIDLNESLKSVINAIAH